MRGVRAGPIFFPIFLLFPINPQVLFNSFFFSYFWKSWFLYRLSTPEIDINVYICYVFLSIGRRQPFMLLLYLSLTIFSSANTVLELLRGVSVPNYLVTNIITSVSIVSNPYKYVIIRECRNMTVSYDKCNLLSLREC